MYSRYTKVYLLKNKDNAFNMFISYIENWLDKKIERVRSDRFGAYSLSNDFCKMKEQINEVTPPYSPKFKDVAERTIEH